MRIVYALAVRSDNTNVIPLSNVNDLLLKNLSLRSCLAEAAGNDHRALDPLLAALLHGLWYESGRNDDNGHVRRFCNIFNAHMAGDVQNGIGLGVDRINSSLKAAVQYVFHNFMTQFVRAGGCPDNCDAFRS